jgi:hypothetical protein
MERRASSPEALEGLFRLDHLTTRMRRHAEGLIILSGAAPGRGWRNPVRLVDVLRGAVAEVEDYARVAVVTASQAMLAGSAVADVIHLLAELIENAVTFSPPNAPVQVKGDIVGNGFAVEIEDRGLGMSEQRLAEVNNRLANPPEFDLSDSERLGLFVVGQLATRHRIQVTLRSSPFGGSTAIVLIPRELVVPEEEYVPGLAGEMSAFGEVRLTGRHAARGDEAMIEAAAPGAPLTGPRVSGALTQARPDEGPAPTVDDVFAPTPRAQEPAAEPAPEPGASVLAPNGSVPDGPVPGGPVPGGPVPNGSRASDGWAPLNADATYKGLPRRVRQASLAPQLRDEGSPNGSASPAVPAAGGENSGHSPEEVRERLAAMQRGWQRGRSSDGSQASGGTATTPWSEMRDPDQGRSDRGSLWSVGRSRPTG